MKDEKKTPEWGLNNDNKNEEQAERTGGGAVNERLKEGLASCNRHTSGLQIFSKHYDIYTGALWIREESSICKLFSHFYE